MIDGVSIRVHQPCKRLRGFVTFFYFVDVRRPVVDFLYPEWGNVRFAITGEWRVEMEGAPSFVSDGAALFGPTDRRGLISTLGGRVTGFGLTPLGWHALVRSDASRMTNRIMPLTDQMGGCGDGMRAALVREIGGDDAVQARMEAWLLARLERQPKLGKLARDLDAALREQPLDVAEFAARAGVSPRTLHRACLTVFGFAPKRLLRLQRFLETLGRIRPAIGEPLAEGMGKTYCDQPQFYRDFRDFMQMTPRAYLSATRAVMAAAAAAQVDAGVTLSFELPDPPHP